MTTASPVPIDCEALLCALVLAPSTYSRNRFFQLYQDAEVRRVRRRASIVRSLVRQFVKTEVEPAFSTSTDGSVEVLLSAPGLGFERRTILEGLEVSLFRYQLARSLGRPADGERARVEAALAKLAGPMPLATGSEG
jgi:hypothetical protein